MSSYPKDTPADSSDQSDVSAQLAEASSEDSDLETDEQNTPFLIPFAPTSQDTISSNLSGVSCPRDVPSPVNTTHKKTAISKQRICILVASHSLVFILGLYLGARYLLNRRLSL